MGRSGDGQLDARAARGYAGDSRPARELREANLHRGAVGSERAGAAYRPRRSCAGGRSGGSLRASRRTRTGALRAPSIGSTRSRTCRTAPFRASICCGGNVHIDARAVLARLPVPVRVLRHHHDLRAQAAREIARATDRRTGHPARAGLAQRGIHRRRQLHRQFEKRAAIVQRTGANGETETHACSRSTPRPRSIWPTVPN